MHVSLRDDETLDRLLVDASPARTPGLHLSAIIRSICRELEPKKYTDGPINPLYTEIGFSFERILEIAFQARRTDILRPGEFERDDVWCSPDGVSWDDLAGPVLEEFKSTELGMPRDTEDLISNRKYRKWFWQMGAYGHVLGTDHACLRVLWLRGDYKAVRRAYQVYDIHWSPGETARIWENLLGHARDHNLWQTAAEGPRT